MITIAHPQIPFCGTIPRPDVGTIIDISGYIPNGASRFKVDFMCRQTNPSVEPDLPFHISFRLDSAAIVRNSRVKGSWETEEWPIPKFPLQAGRAFEVMVLVEEHQYKLAVNGRHIAEFKHRMPFQYIEKLGISGDVTVTRIAISVEPPVIPFSLRPAVSNSPAIIHSSKRASGSFSLSSDTNPSLVPIYNPPVPFVYKIPGGIKPGMVFDISGKPHLNADRFVIDFQNGIQDEPTNIALHFNPRFDHRFRSIVRNTLTNKVWGPEENLGGIPLERGVNFDLRFEIDKECYHVFINGVKFTAYRHRLPLATADALRISGPVMLTLIRISGE